MAFAMKLLTHLVLLIIFGSLASSWSGSDVEYQTTKYHMLNFQRWHWYKTPSRNSYTYTIPYVLEPYQGANMTHINEMMQHATYEFGIFTCIFLTPNVDDIVYLRIRFYKSYTINNQPPRICASSTPGSDWRSNIVYIDMSCSNPLQVLIDELASKFAYQHEDLRPGQDHARDVLNGKRSAIPSYDRFSEPYYQHFYEDDSRIKEDKLGLSFNQIQGILEQYRCHPKNYRERFSGCARSDLPPIRGGGCYYPDYAVYQNKQVIKLVCHEGYEVVGSQYLSCDGTQSDFPDQMVCQKVTCEDNLDHCQSIIDKYNIVFLTSFCDNERYYWQCMKTCGRCAKGDKLCTRIPKVYGYGEILPLKHKYYSGEVIRMECAEGYHPAFDNTATCTNGKFNKEYFHCLPELPPNDEDHLCARIHPDENGTETESGCLNYYEKTHCSPLELDVGPGHFFPAQQLYNIHDVIQLICDDFRQYAIESSGVAQCEINKISGLPYWSHTGLKCVPRIHVDECVDDSDICADISPEDCNTPENAQFARLHCKLKCGFCEGRYVTVCNETPYYDRRVSTISPMKHVYAMRDVVTLKCHPGYKVSDHCIRRSYCLGGYFWPPKLECVPVSSSCNNTLITDSYLFHESGGEFIPRLQAYPSGFKVVRKCLNAGYIDEESNHGELTCTTVNGENILSGSSTCNVTVVPHSCHRKTLEQDLKLLGIKTPSLVEKYRNGVEVYIKCGFELGKMKAVCTNGAFEYYGTCKKMRDERKELTEERSCRRADLPRVYGRGWITPQKQIYQHKEVITMTCERGTTSNTESFTTCNNGKFDRDIFICSDDTCDDTENCERKGCTTKGAGAVQRPLKELYRHGQTIKLRCKDRAFNRVDTCNDGSFGINEPWCESIHTFYAGQHRFNKSICKLMIGECDKPFVQLYCKNECRAVSA